MFLSEKKIVTGESQTADIFISRSFVEAWSCIRHDDLVYGTLQTLKLRHFEVRRGLKHCFREALPVYDTGTNTTVETPVEKQS